MEKLKPCPFCGDEATMMKCTDNKTRMRPVRGADLTDHYIQTLTSFCVRCNKCGVTTKAYRYMRHAFTAWNKRANEDIQDIQHNKRGIREAIEELIDERIEEHAKKCKCLRGI